MFKLFKCVYTDYDDDGHEEKLEHLVVALKAKEAVAKIAEKYGTGILSEPKAWTVEELVSTRFVCSLVIVGRQVG